MAENVPSASIHLKVLFLLRVLYCLHFISLKSLTYSTIRASLTLHSDLSLTDLYEQLKLARFFFSVCLSIFSSASLCISPLQLCLAKLYLPCQKNVRLNRTTWVFLNHCEDVIMASRICLLWCVLSTRCSVVWVSSHFQGLDSFLDFCNVKPSLKQTGRRIWAGNASRRETYVRFFLYQLILYGPRHAKTCLRPYAAYADSDGPDQPAHPRSLISTFTVRYQNHWILQRTNSKICF